MIAVIEMPQGSLLKYEVDKADGFLALDRVLNQPVPYNYGYVPGTLCGDGDPLDVFVLGNIPIHPLTKVKIEILGVLRCLDHDQEDDKLIAMIVGNEEARTMGTDLIRSYLRSYKTGFIIMGSGDAEEALKVYNECVKAYSNKILDDLKAFEKSFDRVNNE